MKRVAFSAIAALCLVAAIAAQSAPGGQAQPPSTSGVIVKGKAPKDMKGKEDYWDVVDVIPGAGLMQKADAFGCNLGSYT